MLLTGHKSRAIFDRYNIINEQELLDAGDQLVAYLAQQAQAVPARRRPHAASPAAPRPPASPPFASCDAAPRKGQRGAAGGRTPPGCAPGIASRPPSTGRPAIVAHAVTGRADAADPGHAPSPTEGSTPALRPLVYAREPSALRRQGPRDRSPRSFGASVIKCW